MKTAREIIECAGGYAVVAESLGLDARHVSNRVSFGKLPASWYDGLEHMTGKTLPRDVFTFKEAAE